MAQAAFPPAPVPASVCAGSRNRDSSRLAEHPHICICISAPDAFAEPAFGTASMQPSCCVHMRRRSRCLRVSQMVPAAAAQDASQHGSRCSLSAVAQLSQPACRPCMHFPGGASSDWGSLQMCPWQLTGLPCMHPGPPPAAGGAQGCCIVRPEQPVRSPPLGSGPGQHPGHPHWRRHSGVQLLPPPGHA